MEILLSFGATALGIIGGLAVFEILGMAFICFVRLDDKDVDMWPVEYAHRHPTFTDEEILQQGFSATDRNQRHGFYRSQIKRKGVELYSRGWVGVLWDRLFGFDAVAEGEEGDDVL